MLHNSWEHGVGNIKWQKRHTKKAFNRNASSPPPKQAQKKNRITSIAQLKKVALLLGSIWDNKGRKKERYFLSFFDILIGDGKLSKAHQSPIVGHFICWTSRTLHSTKRIKSNEKKFNC